MMTFDLYFAL